jgi:hypothetical protein
MVLFFKQLPSPNLPFLQDFKGIGRGYKSASPLHILQVQRTSVVSSKSMHTNLLELSKVLIKPHEKPY